MSAIERIRLASSYLKGKKKDEAKYRKDVEEYILLSEKNGKFPYRKEYERPIIHEYRAAAGSLDEHYFLQDIWMAKKIVQAKTELHYDIGSRVDGFIAHLLVNDIKVNMIDIRPLGVDIEGIAFTRGDATDLSNIEENSIPSLSSLHVVEHFGLGRYGDAIDPQGWIKGLKSMQRIIKSGGYFYFSCPVGLENKLCFNAHRIFDIHEPVETLNQMELIEFAYVKNYKIINVPISDFSDYIMKDDYACGMYVFRKKG